MAAAVAQAAEGLEAPSTALDMGWQGRYVHAYIVVHSAETLAGNKGLFPPMSLLFPAKMGVGAPKISDAKVKDAKANMQRLQEEHLGGLVPRQGHPEVQRGIQQWVTASMRTHHALLETSVRQVQFVDHLVQRCQQQCDKNKVLKRKAALLQQVAVRLRHLHDAARWALQLRKEGLVECYQPGLEQLLQASSTLTREQVAAGLLEPAELQLAAAMGAADAHSTEAGGNTAGSNSGGAASAAGDGGAAAAAPGAAAGAGGGAPDAGGTAAAAGSGGAAAGGGAAGVAAMKVHMLQQRSARLQEELRLVPLESQQLYAARQQRVQELEAAVMSGAAMEGVQAASSAYLLGQELKRARFLLGLAEKHKVLSGQQAAGAEPLSVEVELMQLDDMLAAAGVE
jgi:hypothetical protein